MTSRDWTNRTPSSPSLPSRRNVLRAGLAAGFGMAAFGAKAQTMMAQTEWFENFDTTAPQQVPVHSARPSLSSATAGDTEQAIASYSDIAARGVRSGAA